MSLALDTYRLRYLFAKKGIFMDNATITSFTTIQLARFYPMLGGILNISLASAGDAISRPYSLDIRTMRSTN